MTEFITINGNKIEIEEPEINKLYQELTRLIMIAGVWEDKQCATLLRICLKARDRRKMIYGHPKNASPEEKKFNTFYCTTMIGKESFSVFVTGIGIQINDEDISPAEAYIKLIKNGICNYKKNNVFGVIREGNIFSKYYNYKIIGKE